MSHSTVASLLRTNQAYCGQVCEKETLEHGIAFTCRRFPDIAEVNQFREVVIDEPSRLPSAFTTAEAWFEGCGLKCQRWAPAVNQPIEAISSFLAARGFQSRSIIAMVLNSWPESMGNVRIRILPARSMRAALQKTFRLVESAPPAKAQTSQCELIAERLDDATFDLYVAVVDSMPAGRCALYQVGDIARVMEFHVLPEFDDTPVAASLLAHVVAQARRLAMRTICAAIDEEDQRTHARLVDAGFVHDGGWTEFDRR